MDIFSLADIINAVIQVRRGTNAEREQYVYNAGEIIYTTDSKRLYVGDGSTYGGVVVGNKTWITNNFVSLGSINKYDLVYRTDLSNFYILTGDNKNSLDNYLQVSGNISGGSYTLPPATTTTLGGLIVSTGLTVDNTGAVALDIDNSTIKISNNKLYVNTSILSSIVVPYATSSTTGTVIPKNGLSVNGNGELNVQFDASTIILSSGKLVVNQSGLTAMSFSTGTQTITSSTITFIDGISADTSGNITLKSATNLIKGGIILGQGLSGNGGGIVNIPIATQSIFGGGILGNTLSSSSSGIINVLIDNDTIQFNGSTLKADIGRFDPAVARGWVNFDGTGAVGVVSGALLRSTYNNLSVTKIGTGIYRIYWPLSLSANDSYVVNGMCSTPSLGTSISVALSTQNLTSVVVNTTTHGGGSPASTDLSIVSISIFSN